MAGISKPALADARGLPGRPSSREVRKTWEAPMLAAMTLPEQDRLLRRDQGRQEGRRLARPGGRRGEALAGRQGGRRSREDPDARDDPRQEQAARRPRLRPDPPDRVRGGPASPHPRLRPLHPRRDPGPRHGDARHLRRRADRRGVRGREREHVPAPLQLPALLGRRSEVPARPVPPRHRPRQPRAPGAGRRCCPTRRRSPTRSASSRTSSNPTAPRRWPRSAAALSR